MLQTETQSPSTAGTLAHPSDPDATAQFEAFKQNLSTGLIALGSVMMIFVIARMLRRLAANRRAHATQPTRQRPTPIPSTGPGPTASHDRLERLMTDAEELTRRLAAILENKAEKIEILIEQADQRIQQLEAATLPAHSQSQSQQGETTHSAESLPSTEPAAHTPIRPVTTEPADPIDPLHRKVYDLADQGLAPVDIARQIDRPTGQIELILALRRA